MCTYNGMPHCPLKWDKTNYVCLYLCLISNYLRSCVHAHSNPQVTSTNVRTHTYIHTHIHTCTHTYIHTTTYMLAKFHSKETFFCHSGHIRRTLLGAFLVQRATGTGQTYWYICMYVMYVCM
jgi:hypothetical protein